MQEPHVTNSPLGLVCVNCWISVDQQNHSLSSKIWYFRQTRLAFFSISLRHSSLYVLYVYTNIADRQEKEWSNKSKQRVKKRGFFCSQSTNIKKWRKEKKEKSRKKGQKAEEGKKKRKKEKKRKKNKRKKNPSDLIHLTLPPSTSRPYYFPPPTILHFYTDTVCYRTPQPVYRLTTTQP